MYGKIKQIVKDNQPIAYTYDPSGHRVSKSANGLSTWYVRDAQGNALAVYDNKAAQINWREQHLYGSSRLGMWNPNMKLAVNAAKSVWDTIGRKEYELSNHLGNVMSVINDKRVLTEDGYRSLVRDAKDYYAFGSMMPERKLSSNYRYGFNGKENDNEVNTEGNQQDYGMRIYDPRVGRFLSVDPITREYPELTPYQFASNRPIDGIDLDGLEFRKAPGMFSAKGYYVPQIKSATSGMVADIVPNRLPEYYKRMKVSDFSSLKKIAEGTKFKLQQMTSDDEATNSRQAREGALGIALSSIVDKSPEVQAYNQMVEQLREFQMSENLANEAYKLPSLIPKQFKNDPAFKANLINFIFDGSKAQGTGSKLIAYNELISLLGAEIYNNQQQIFNGSYQRKALSIEVVKSKFGLDHTSPVQPHVRKYYGEDQVKRAVDKYNNAKDGGINCSVIGVPNN